jgi:PAS domain S-box-containing protein
MPDKAAPSPGSHLSIGLKIVLLFSVLALAVGGSWLVVQRALTQLDGTATEINTYGSLRYLSQQIHLELQGAVNDGGAVDKVERLMGEYERKLGLLAASRVGTRVGDQARHVLAAMNDDWVAYRDGVRRLLGSRGTPAATEAELRLLSAQAAQLLEQADRATWIMSDSISRQHEEARDEFALLALLDTAFLVLAYAYIRRRIALPLRELAGVTLRFARGEHGARSGFRSHDETGRLAEAFDHMAAETERHIGIIAADLDDIRRKEAELRKLTQAIEHSPVAVIVTDAEARIEYVNPRFSEVTGFAVAEVLGRKPSLLQSGQTLPETYREMWQTILSGKVWRGELLNRKKNGELFWENAQISPIRDEAGKITHFVAVKEDITAKKHAEQELMMLNIELERRVADRTRQLESANSELRTFNHSVSHDLRTPLRAINGFAQAIEEEGAACLKGELRDYLRRIQAAAVRMGELIDDLLALGRIGQIEVDVVAVNLSGIAHEILDRLAAAEPDRRVESVVVEGIVVKGDPRLLRIALECLLGNAWKFTADRDPARITFGYAMRDGHSVLAVSDNGAGFNMDYADKLFRPFQRLHAADKYPGKGIGLAKVKRVIDLHGGHIRAEGKVGKGATFCFELPDEPDLHGEAPAERAELMGAQ